MLYFLYRAKGRRRMLFIYFAVAVKRGKRWKKRMESNQSDQVIYLTMKNPSQVLRIS